MILQQSFRMSINPLLIKKQNIIINHIKKMIWLWILRYLLWDWFKVWQLALSLPIDATCNFWDPCSVMQRTLRHAIYSLSSIIASHACPGADQPMSNGRSLDPFGARGRSGSISRFSRLGSRDYRSYHDSDRSIKESTIDPRHHDMKSRRHRVRIILEIFAPEE